LSLSWQPRPIFDHPHGVIRAVTIPVAVPPMPPPPEVLARLAPEERAFAAGLPPFRQLTWVAGRLALAAALAELGAPRTPLLATPRDAPAPPPGFVGSVSHKKRIAVALAAPDEGAHVGIDVEETAPQRYDISQKILTARELAAADARSPEERGRAVVAWFSIKESIYKAVDPFVQRYVGFKEAEVDLEPPTWGFGSGAPMAARARLTLERGEGPFAVEATWAELDGLIVSTARVRAT
jgi:enterobactin synthetase component D